MESRQIRSSVHVWKPDASKCSLAFAAIPVQAWTGPQGSWRLRLAECRQSAHEGLRLLFLCTGRLYPPGKTPDTHFC
jgi:hypothetical protein